MSALWKARAILAESEVQRLRDEMRSLRIYLAKGESGTHAAIGDPCGIDACIVCLAEHVVQDALRRAPQPNA
jgi:hypothetical protein